MLAIIPSLTTPMLRWGPRRMELAAIPPADDLIDFPASPLFAAYFADQRMTPRLPDGYPVERKPAWEPLPILDLNEREWEEMQDAIAQLLNLNNDEPEPPAPSPAVPTPVRPRPTPPPAASEPIEFPVPAPKLKGWWRHQ